MLRQEPSIIFTPWEGSSFSLWEREDLIRSYALSEQYISDLPLNYFLAAKRDYKVVGTLEKSIQNWLTQNIVASLRLSNFSPFWDSLWAQNFSFPPSYFYLRSIWEKDKSLKRSELSLRFFADFDSYSSKLLSEPLFNDAHKYASLINSEVLTEELRKRARAKKGDTLCSELARIDLLKQVEIISNRLVEKGILSPDSLTLADLDSTLELKITDVPELTKEEKKDLSILPTWLGEKRALGSHPEDFVLPNSLPSLFLFNLQTNQLSESVCFHQIDLKEVPNWVKKISKLFSFGSITRYISQERMKALDKSEDVRKITKENVQWLDPEEKWFYLYLPILNLWFDRFREKYISSLVTTWEEPEITFSLTSVEDSGDCFDTSRAYQKPIFLYEGIPSLKIGEDLELIEQLITSYEKHHEDQALRELKEEGIFPLPKNSSISSEELEEIIAEKEAEEQEI